MFITYRSNGVDGHQFEHSIAVRCSAGEVSVFAGQKRHPGIAKGLSVQSDPTVNWE